MASDNAVSYAALQYSLAALAKAQGGGGGGSTGGTVRVEVVETITGAPRTDAKVVNLGTEQEVLLQFTIPQGLEGKAGSQWYISEEVAGTPVEGTNDGDLILYTSGDIYKVVDGIPVDQKLNIGQKEKSLNPYEYAVSIGFIGTKDEFDIRFLTALGGGATNTRFDGGSSIAGTETVILDGGIADSSKEDFITDGNLQL